MPKSELVGTLMLLDFKLILINCGSGISSSTPKLMASFEHIHRALTFFAQKVYGELVKAILHYHRLTRFLGETEFIA